VVIFKHASFSWAKPSQIRKPSRRDKKNKGKSKKKLTVNIQRRDSTSSSETETSERLFMLKDISLEIGREEFIGIGGRVGSGKTSLLLSIIGEMLKKGGDIQIPENLNSKLIFLFCLNEIRGSVVLLL
jgi:ABC-type polysaccharide/polyol phosphate transport system ATPase subunit